MKDRDAGHAPGPAPENPPGVLPGEGQDRPHRGQAGTPVPDRTGDLLRAARMYWLQGQTMDAVAKDLGVSRPTVSRLLKKAREAGLVRITVADPQSSEDELATRFGELFGVRARVVPVRARSGPEARMDQVARVGAAALDELMVPGTVLGVAWGSTVTEIARHLVPREVPDSIVVQLNGAGNARRSGIPYTGAILDTVAEAFGSRVVHFPVPAFFDFPGTKEAMWRERSIRGVLGVQERAQVAVFGVGAMDGAVPSHVYSSGYFDSADFESLRRARIAGDICTVLLREDGSWRDIGMNARATGPDPEQLRKIGRRLCVVAGEHRAPALLGALRAGAVTDVVVDSATARLVLHRAGTTGGR